MIGNMFILFPVSTEVDFSSAPNPVESWLLINYNPKVSSRQSKMLPLLATNFYYTLNIAIMNHTNDS